MTIKMPGPTIGDRILKLLGKRRGVIIPSDSYNKFGPYASIRAEKENFWRALIRSKNAPLPDNVITYNFFKEEIERKLGG
jgi:hypothetical protein